MISNVQRQGARPAGAKKVKAGRKWQQRDGYCYVASNASA